LIWSLQPGFGSNGNAFPARTVMVECETSAPSIIHLPRTITLAGPLTIFTFRTGLNCLIYSALRQNSLS
jgi:hypothetical protein